MSVTIGPETHRCDVCGAWYETAREFCVSSECAIRYHAEVARLRRALVSIETAAGSQTISRHHPSVYSDIYELARAALQSEVKP